MGSRGGARWVLNVTPSLEAASDLRRVAEKAAATFPLSDVISATISFDHSPENPSIHPSISTRINRFQNSPPWWPLWPHRTLTLIHQFTLLCQLSLLFFPTLLPPAHHHHDGELFAPTLSACSGPPCSLPFPHHQYDHHPMTDTRSPIFTRSRLVLSLWSMPPRTQGHHHDETEGCISFEITHTPPPYSILAAVRSHHPRHRE